jgi:hypothetical protein
MMHAVDTHEFLFVAILFYLGTRQLIHHHKKGQGKKKTNSGGLESVCMRSQLRDNEFNMSGATCSSAPVRSLSL